MHPPLTPWRDLPWRRTRDPWAVLVSEVMLQQTQVARVVPKWEQFMERWPTPAACAAAPAADVVRAWGGLGYNRRALNLHRCACAVVDRHGGRLPAGLAELLDLPGIGPYTARAVLAFAFEQDVAIVDTNVARVLTRAVADRSRSLQALADGLVPPGEGWAWNQAMLDVGATVCTARAPKCGECPFRETCAWMGDGPDPWVPVRQSKFAGSDRQGRGRLLDALRAGPVRWDRVTDACGWPSADADRAERVAAGVIRDGFATRRGASLVLRRSSRR